MKVNEMVQIHKGNNSMGGIFIYEEFITGTVVKVNKKSVRVHMSQAKCLTNGKVTREYNINEEATFTFWKPINKQSGTVDVYKNPKYGIIKIAH
jgi:hypothetical protein